MNKKVIIPVVLIGSGIGLYFLNKAGKLDKLKALFNKKDDEIISPIVQTIQPSVTIQPPKTNPNIIVSNPFTQAELLAFQKWVNLTYKPTIPLVEDGIWGDNSAGAYNSYGTAYANKEKTTPTPTNKGIIVDLADLLATNPKGANGKMLYAGVTGIGIKNLSNVITDKTKANTLLGGILSVTKTSNASYKIIFIKGTGIQYYINYYTQNPEHFYVKI